MMQHLDTYQKKKKDLFSIAQADAWNPVKIGPWTISEVLVASLLKHYIKTIPCTHCVVAKVFYILSGQSH
jgi:hypothetical protein